MNYREVREEIKRVVVEGLDAYWAHSPDGGCWFVAGTGDEEKARLKVMEHLSEQYLVPLKSVYDWEMFGIEAYDALFATATTYNFVVVDDRDERCYHEASPEITPQNARENGVTWLGFGTALGFRMPEWKNRHTESIQLT